MGEAGRRFRDRGEIVTSCDATTPPRSITAFRQHLLCRHPIPAFLRALPHAPFGISSPRRQVSQTRHRLTDNAWVVRVTLSTLHCATPVAPCHGALLQCNWLRWLLASEALYVADPVSRYLVRSATTDLPETRLRLPTRCGYSGDSLSPFPLVFSRLRGSLPSKPSMRSGPGDSTLCDGFS